MAGWSFKFDPATGDLIKDGKGSFVRTFHADTHLQLQLKCHAGRCWQDAELGSFLYDRSRFQRDPVKLVPDEVRRAMGVLAKRGRLGNIDVTASEPAPGRVDVEARARDTSTGKPVTASLTTGG